MPDRIGAIDGGQLVLDGVGIGFLRSADGGSPIGTVVSEKLDASPIAKKHLGGIAYSPLVMQCGPGVGSALFDWINASWRGQAQPKDGSIVTADVNLTAMSQRDFVRALIAETTIPALDGSSKDAVYLTVTLTPQFTRDSKPSGRVTGDVAKQKLWTAANFRIRIDGLDCTRVVRVDALTVRQKIGDAGDARADRQAGQLEFPNLNITMSMVGSDTWLAWFDDFVLKGNNDQSKEKNGSIALLSPDMKDELLRIDLFNLGIFAIQRTDTASDRLARLTAQLYCERMELHLPDKAHV